MALLVIVTVLAGYTLLTVINVLSGAGGRPPGAAGLIGFGVCLLLVLSLQLAHSAREPRRWSSPVRLATLSAQVLVTFLPFLWLGWPWAAMPGFLAGSTLLTLTGPVRWILYAAVGGGVLTVMSLQGEELIDLVYLTYATYLTGLVVFAVGSLPALAGEIHGARGQLAQLAVARERLRVARDLHDLLGYSLSAMTLKSELTYRLLPAAPDRARNEVGEVLGVARQALADVRVVATGDRTMSLRAEAESANSILAAAEIEPSVEINTGDLPKSVDTVLAIVLREAVTNTLRHSKARWCVIEAVLEGDTVRLRVENDGVEPNAEPSVAGDETGNGSGLANLAARLEAIGGGLTADTEGNAFRLRAHAPAARTRLREPAKEGGEAAPRWGLARLVAPDASPPAESAESWPWRKAQLIIVAVVLGYAVVLIVNVLAVGTSVRGLLGFLPCLLVLVAVQLAHSMLEPRRWRWQARALSLFVLALATFLPILWIGTPWGSMTGFLAGSALLVVASRLRWVLFAAVAIGAVGVTVIGQGLQPDWIAYLLISSPLTGLIIYGSSLLSGLVTEVRAARDELARMAVTKERLRVARDLNELLGHELSTMTLKSELAYRLLPRNPERARGEVEEVLGMARRAVANVRAVASGYRHMSLAAEVESAVSTFSAAGIQVRVELRPREVPEEIDAVFALVLQEGTTNVLRHSAAQRCLIETAVGDGQVRLRISNDGVVGTPRPDLLASGHGLGDLAERLSAVGGGLDVDVEEDWFHLTARIPVAGAGSEPPDRPEADMENLFGR